MFLREIFILFFKNKLFDKKIFFYLNHIYKLIFLKEQDKLNPINRSMEFCQAYDKSLNFKKFIETFYLNFFLLQLKLF